MGWGSYLHASSVALSPASRGSGISSGMSSRCPSKGRVGDLQYKPGAWEYINNIYIYNNWFRKHLSYSEHHDFTIGHQQQSLFTISSCSGLPMTSLGGLNKMGCCLCDEPFSSLQPNPILFLWSKHSSVPRDTQISRHTHTHTLTSGARQVQVVTCLCQTTPECVMKSLLKPQNQLKSLLDNSSLYHSFTWFMTCQVQDKQVFVGCRLFRSKGNYFLTMTSRQYIIRLSI